MAIKSYHKKLNFVKNKAEMKIFFAVFAIGTKTYETYKIDVIFSEKQLQ